MSRLHTICPRCRGEGETDFIACPGGYTGKRICGTCQGAGHVDERRHLELKRADQLNRWRRSTGLSLSEFANQHGIHPRQLSHWEHGRDVDIPEWLVEEAGLDE